MAGSLVRKTINFPNSTVEELDYLGDQTALNQTDVLKYAVNTYASLAKMALAGVLLYVKDHKGNEIPFALPGFSEIYTQHLIAAAMPPAPSEKQV